MRGVGGEDSTEEDLIMESRGFFQDLQQIRFKCASLDVTVFFQYHRYYFRIISAKTYKSNAASITPLGHC